MNVYVANSRAPWLGSDTTSTSIPAGITPKSATRYNVEPGFESTTSRPGQPPLDRKVSPTTSRSSTDSVATLFRCHGTPDAIHANYWLSGLAGHRLKHELSIPLIMTFHTLSA